MPTTHALPVYLTKRELTLIRVACIQRLDVLKSRLGQSPNCEQSYQQTRELLNGKLWFAVTVLRELDKGEFEP